MEFTRTERGFGRLELEPYAAPRDEINERLAQHSSAISDKYDDAIDRPGTSYLWISEHHHLDREQVAQFIKHLQSWLDTGSLELESP